MILKCITNWSSNSNMRSLPNNGEDMVAACGPSPSPLNGVILFDDEEEDDGRRLGISPRDHPWDEVSMSTTKSSTEETTNTDASTLTGPPEQYYGSQYTSDDQYQLNLENAVSLADSSDTGAVTLMGPPKQYYGESAEDRYAYMLHEAVSLLHKHGFSTNITTLRHQALQTSAVNHHKVSTKQNKQFHRVPGILGFLLNHMTSHTKIAVFEPENDELVAYLGFMSYNQPWLKVCCRLYLPGHAQVIDLLQLILSKRFLLINLPHETRATPLKLPTRSAGCAKAAGGWMMVKGGKDLILKMTTTMSGKRCEEEKLWTMFVVEKSGTPVAKALWSYACEGVDSAGPTMEMFETIKSGRNCDTSFVPGFLAHMEDVMIQIFAPLVAFRLRFCYVDDYPQAARWLSQRGYVKNKQDNTYLHKAFVVF